MPVNSIEGEKSCGDGAHRTGKKENTGAGPRPRVISCGMVR